MKAKPPGIPNEHLRHARQYQGLSQDHLAALVGTNAFTISRWERGVARPSPFYIQRLVEVLRQNAEALGLLTTLAGALSLTPQKRDAFLDVARTARATTHEDSPLPTELTAPQCRIPAPPTPLIGREDDLAVVRRLLGDPPSDC
jgi:transcriptional regulator with XRE-family HTH domain